MTSSSSNLLSSIASLDPTGIASTVMDIALKFKDQYDQMAENKEICEGLNKQISVIQQIITDLNKAKQIDSCKQTLVELHSTLTRCLKLIQSITAKKNFMGKVKDFMSSDSNKNLISKLTTQLHDMADILNLALTAQTSNDVKNLMSLMAKTQSEKIPNIRNENNEIDAKLDAFVREINQVINVSNNTLNSSNTNSVNVIINAPASSSQDGRDSPDITRELSSMRDGEQLHVLKHLKEFFRDARDEGEKSRNFAIYKKYVESEINVGFSYNGKEKRHILFVNDEPLSARDSVKYISKMIDTITSCSSVSQGSASVASSTPQFFTPVTMNSRSFNAQESKHTDKLVSQAEFKVNTQLVNTVLKLVVEGEQDQVEKLLVANPSLGVSPGAVTDLSGRSFEEISPFQYAIWALDWHMWTMIQKYIPEEKARENIDKMATGAWVKQHGTSVSWQNLLDAYQKYKKLRQSATISASKADECWQQEVGKAQRLLPAHVVNEFCRPDRAFSFNDNRRLEPPDFTDAKTLPRTRQTDSGEWYTATFKNGKLGENFAYFRSIMKVCSAMKDKGWTTSTDEAVDRADFDSKACEKLLQTRIQQRNELFAELSNTQQSQRQFRKT